MEINGNDIKWYLINLVINVILENKILNIKTKIKKEEFI